ncbi:MAG: ArnT family glycosyltransferase, partial [Candidatus Puniceispirillaceae bacterium]
MSSRTVSYSSNLTVAPAMFWGLLLASLAVRLYAVIISPLEPSVDEAQYWLWGQTPQLGYYSKPPLIAWILAGTSSVLDHQNFGQLLALRISAPLIHTLTALFLWQTGRLLFSDNAGRLAAILWISLPAVGLGSFVMSTDTPLLLFWSAGLYCLVRAVETFHPNYRWMALAGICVGLATLAKYAGLYFILSLVLWIMTSSFRK